MRILITGVTGTLGQVLTRELAKDNHELIGISRDEQKQRKLVNFPGTLYLGDVRDSDRILEASRGVELIFHLAALKCVDTLEKNPEEAFQTNTVGTANVLHAQRINGIPRVVLTSTDKAVYPINAYGISKAAAEALVRRNPNNVVCRYGNVIGSRGSVVPLFIEKFKKDGEVEITHTNMTRFWMTQDEACDWVKKAAFAETGGLAVPYLKSASIMEVAYQTAKIMTGIEKDIRFREIGLRGREKIHECLKASHEGDRDYHSDQAERFTGSELREMLAPVIQECA